MSVLRHVLYLGGMAVLVAYLLNPGAGVIELLPDQLPIVGNLDEAAAVGLLIALFKKWRTPPPLPESGADTEPGAEAER
jgi:uncharacterized membrane protein YkvA (DUF1232 family)